MRNEINLTDDQILDAFEAIDAYYNFEDIVFTSETLADFEAARENYSERGQIERAENAIIIRNAQVAKGHQRGDIYIIDFGAARGVVKG